MNLTIVINGTEKKVSTLTAENMFKMITTVNPVEGVERAAANLAGGDAKAYHAAFSKTGKPEDVIEVHADGEFSGRSTRKALALKIWYAITRNEWVSELPDSGKGTRTAADKGAAEVV